MFTTWISTIFLWSKTGLSWILLLVGAIGGLYFFWRKADEEHFDLVAAFDAVFIAMIGGFLGARLGYVLLHPLEFGLSIFKVLNVFSFPGLWPVSGFVVAFYTMHRFAQQTKLDIWEVWDFFCIFVAWYFGWHWLSRFVAGAAAGTSTSLPWGIVFPNRVEPAHPVQLYAAAGYFLIFSYLLWAEPRYRFFFWYRSKKRTAKTGYLFSIFLLSYGLLQFGLSFFQPVFFLLPGGFELNQALGILIFLSGCVLLYLRSGRSLFAR